MPETQPTPEQLADLSRRSGGLSKDYIRGLWETWAKEQTNPTWEAFVAWATGLKDRQ